MSNNKVVQQIVKTPYKEKGDTAQVDNISLQVSHARSIIHIMHVLTLTFSFVKHGGLIIFNYI